MIGLPAIDEPLVARHRERRRLLSAAVGGRPILLMGHRAQARKFLANQRPFRQDSTFLYFMGLSRPGLAALIEEGGETTLFVPTADPGDALWHGALAPPQAWAASAGAEHLAEAHQLQAGPYLTLPCCEPLANAYAAELSGLALDPNRPLESGSAELRRAVIEQRLVRDDFELAQHRLAIEATERALRVAMGATHPGVSDIAVEALITAVFALHGMEPAYAPIVTARGEVLHGHASGEKLAEGQLLLVDAGAESAAGYAADITRTWPVAGKFDARQRDVYEAVLTANKVATARVAPELPYGDVHLAACRSLCGSLTDLGLLRGEVDGLLEQGAHAAFFPHGIGHLLGLDVHDMELLGDEVGYEVGACRSEQFGLSFLRLQRAMQPGMVVTIEPGLYFVPELLGDPELRTRLGDSVCWDKAETWLGFGGIRIEDDVLVTSTGHEVLSAAIPCRAEAIEALVATGPTPEQRLLSRTVFDRW